MKATKELVLFVALVLMMTVVHLVSGSFFSPINLISLIKGNAVLMVASMGMLVVILTGGIDVSAASILAAATVVVGNFVNSVVDSVLLALVAGCVVAVLLGGFNGFLVARLRIPPIVATLGMMSITLGSVLLITDGQWVVTVPERFSRFGSLSLGRFMTDPLGRRSGIPIQALIMIGVVVFHAWVLRFTRFGRALYAIGGNRQSAERVGIDVEKTTVLAYAYEGLWLGVAGFIHTSIIGQVDPNAFVGYELQIIAAVVLGGASVLGGEGTIVGTILGVSLFSVINNGLILMRVPSFWQKIVVGMVLIATVTVNIINQHRRERLTVRVDVASREIA